MADLAVTYQEIKDVATKLTAGQANLTDKLTELKGLVDGLIGAGFATGSASGAFQTSYGEFNTGATQTIGGLEGLATFLNKAAEAFEKTDTELGSALKK